MQCVDCGADAEIWDSNIPLCLNCLEVREADWHQLRKRNRSEGRLEKDERGQKLA